MTGPDLVAAALGQSSSADDYALSDIGNAELLLERHGVDLHYVHPWNRWLVWDGTRWQQDDVGATDAMVKESLRWLTASANKISDPGQRKKLLRFALDSERAGRVRAALQMAQSENGIPVVPDDLDRDPWIINVSNGKIDLRTGELRSHDRADLATMIAPVDYDPSATCPLWLEFLDRILDGNEELITFMQRVIGYSLTGLTTEQIILIVWGPGANGKSVLINTIIKLLGDYAQQAPAETFLARRDSIPNDVARLRGARMVAAAELGEGRRLNEALVKRMTGGDKVTARFMRAEWFEFDPQFTPWLATNHKPEIIGTDLGIWRRIRLVPFTVTIPEAERDPLLAQKLEHELPGILAWAVQGCLDWQQHGLTTPDAVTAATADYRNDQDVLGRFLEDCCDLSPDNRVKAGELHTRLGYWSNENGHETLTAKALANRLKERGLVNERSKNARYWVGIALRGGGDG